MTRNKGCRVMIKLIAIAVIVILSNRPAYAQKPVNWTPGELMEPATLANSITANKEVPVIISVGPGAVIPHSINAGMASTPEGMAALNAKLDSLPKNTKVIIYCGCCPFEHCPNVRPAIDALKEKGFTNYYLLNLPDNIKMDWINKGYPTQAK